MNDRTLMCVAAAVLFSLASDAGAAEGVEGTSTAVEPSFAQGPALASPGASPGSDTAAAGSTEVPAPEYRLIAQALTFDMGWAGLYPTSATTHRLGIGRGDLFTMGLGAVFYDMLAIGGDFGMGAYHDSRSFTENTTAGEMSSTATALYGALTAGVRTPRLILHDYVAFTAGADVGIATIGGSRGVENCMNCSEQSLSVDGGPFYGLRFAAGGASRSSDDWEAPIRLAGLGITYRHPLGSSDLDHWLMITLGLY